MQVLKEEVRQRILKSSRKEFLKRGYEKASMRAIASQANMTVGNLYRYYKNKEDLFGAIVGELYDQLMDLRNRMPEGANHIHWLLDQFQHLQKDHRNEWLILFGGSEGTRFARVADETMNLLRDTIQEDLTRRQRSPEIAAPVASAIIYGLNTILRTDRKNSTEVANDFLNYMMDDIRSDVA